MPNEKPTLKTDLQPDHPMTPDNTLLIETGWEVCWQLGGIYTVLRSKAPVMVEKWGDRYCLLGPYNAATAPLEFESLPREGILGRTCDLLDQRGIQVHYGRWLITGKPQVVLIDFLKSFHRTNQYKYQLWQDHQIETHDDREVNDVVLFGYLAAEFFEVLTQVIAEFPQKKEQKISLPVIGHFHEWMAGVPIPVIKLRKLPVKTVFTTHATLLGRYLALSDSNFYNNLPWMDPHKLATQKNIYPRFAIERAAAWGATQFTTISEITATEAKYILGRKPDSILPNGLNIQRFTAVHQAQNLHAQFKERINEFVMGHFFPSYSFDLDQTMYVFTAGRYEYQNKGIDMFIESLARLNWKLKCEKQSITVVAFIVTRAAHRGINVETLRTQVMFKSISQLCNSLSEQMGNRLLSLTSQGKQPAITDLLKEYDQLRLRRLVHAWKQTSRLPSIVTHNMQHDSTDSILCQLRSCNLYNRKEDPVKVIFHPEFMTSTSPILGLDYDQFVRGCHLGVFPSYYEPWGYTPLECAALGIPSITSDLSGFGSYLEKNIPDHDSNGLIILNRKNKDFYQSAEALMESMKKVLTLTRRERIELRNRVEAQSVKFDWKELITAYHQAHEMAFMKE